jgi:hypothetical protein
VAPRGSTSFLETENPRNRNLNFVRGSTRILSFVLEQEHFVIEVYPRIAETSTTFVPRFSQSEHGNVGLNEAQGTN